MRRQREVRPIILAGGLGTRLRPRTEHLPKPLLPVNGRPLLWYVINSLKGTFTRRPIVILAYKGDLIRAFFETENVTFQETPNRTMAEAFLAVAENDHSNAFLGMSSDVLIHPKGVDVILDEYHENTPANYVLFVKLSGPGHKTWKFEVLDGCLKDVLREESKTNFERVLLLLTRETVFKLRELLPSPVREEDLPSDLRQYQTGWTLILKSCVMNGVSIRARFVDIPVQNVNGPEDFRLAEDFVKRYRMGS